MLNVGEKVVDDFIKALIDSCEVTVDGKRLFKGGIEFVCNGNNQAAIYFCIGGKRVYNYGSFEFKEGTIVSLEGIFEQTKFE